MNKIRKILIGCLVAVMCTFGTIITAEAKEVQISVEFAFDAEFEAEIQEYVLYYKTSALPEVLIEVAQIGDSSVREFETPVFDIAPLSSMEYILSAVYNTGEEVFSDPFPFRFMGAPTIIRIIIIK